MDHDRGSAIDYLADNYEFEIVFNGGEIRTNGGNRPLPKMTLADLKDDFEGWCESLLKPSPLRAVTPRLVGLDALLDTPADGLAFDDSLPILVAEYVLFDLFLGCSDIERQSRFH